jgi:hypothetical protein
MRAFLLNRQSSGGAAYVLVFAPGDEVLSGLLQFARSRNITGAHFSAIGALSKATLRWYDTKQQAYKVNRVRVQSELTSLIGNIAILGNAPAVHAHANVAFKDGSVRGGHALELFVYPTVELFMQVEPAKLTKRVDPQTGLAVIAAASRDLM